jgi:hypothetical protein
MAEDQLTELEFLRQLLCAIDITIEVPVAPNLQLQEDLGLDSLHIFEAVLFIEDMTGCEVRLASNVYQLHDFYLLYSQCLP